MPEEEETFTFVDKRKTGAAAEAGAGVAEEPDETGSADAASVADEPETQAYGASEGIPSVYDLLLNIVQLLSAEAWLKMGLIANPSTGVASVDLPQARIAIDTVADIVGRLESAPEGVLVPATRRDLRNLLNDLRLNFVNQRPEGES